MKENYLRVMRGEIPEYLPAPYIEHCCAMIEEDQLTPVFAPSPVTTVYGVTYVGSSDFFNGAMPAPGPHLLDDISDWPKVIKNPDNSHRDWEGYYRAQTDRLDRVNKCVKVSGGDYFLTLVSFMGFEGALIAMYTEPEAVYALFEYISEHYLEVAKQEIRYVKPDIYGIMDDDAAALAPFYSVETYRELVKPFHKKHADLALENGILLDRHDCGHCESFIDDWIEMGIRAWNPAQVMNDLVGIKKKYGRRLALAGCWDNTGVLGTGKVDLPTLRDELVKYIDTFAPDGGFFYCAGASGCPSNPRVAERLAVIREVWETYGKDYYKTHGY